MEYGLSNKLFCFTVLYIGILLIKGEQSELHLRILILTDRVEQRVLCQLPIGDNVTTTNYFRRGNVATTLTWKFVSEPFKIIVEVRNSEALNYDIILVDSCQHVYESVKTSLLGKSIYVLQWSPNNINAYHSAQAVLKHCCSNMTYTDDLFHTTKLKRNTILSIAIASFISKIETDNLFVILQNDRGAGVVFDASQLDLVDKQFVKYDSTALQSRENIHAMLQETTRLLYINRVRFILICDHPCADKILQEVTVYDRIHHTALHQFSKWLIFADRKYKSVYQVSGKELDNLAFVSLSNAKYSNTCEAKLMNTFQRRLMDLASAVRLPTKQSFIVYFISAFQIFAENISPHAASFLTETLLWKPHGRQFCAVGSFNLTTINAIHTDAVFPNIKFGFNNRTLSVGTLKSSRFILKEEKNGKVEYKGYCIDLLNNIASVLNFSYRIVEPDDGQFGMLTVGDNWTGLVGMLQRRVVDIVAVDLSVDYRRERVMDFTFPFFSGYITGLLKKPSPANWKTYIKPFKWKVFLALGLTLPTSCLLYYILEKYNTYYKKKKNTDEYRVSKYSEMLVYFLGAFVSQGSVLNPASMTGRTFMSMFWLFCIIITSLYSGNLVAFLAVTRDIIPFTTLAGLVKQDTYKWGLMNGTIFVTLFRDSNDASFKAVWNGIERFEKDDKAVLTRNKSIHLQKVSAGSYVYIGGTHGAEDLSTIECDFFTLEDRVYPHYYAFGLQNNSPYNRLISDRLMAISESGWSKFWQNKWWPKNKTCAEGLKVQSKKLSVVDIQSAFYLIGAGIGLATLTLLAEIVVHRRRDRKNEKIVRTSESNTIEEEQNYINDWRTQQ